MFSSCLGNFCGVGSPQMLRRVGAPGSPGFGATKQTFWSSGCAVKFGGAAKQADVGCGECVHFADGAKRDIFRGPLADSRDVAEKRDGLFDGAEGAEQIWIARSG